MQDRIGAKRKATLRTCSAVLVIVMLAGILTACGGGYNSSTKQVTVKKDAFKSVTFELVSTDREKDGARAVVINGEVGDLLESGLCVIQMYMIDSMGNKVYADNINITMEITSEGQQLANEGIFFLFDADGDYEQLYIYYNGNEKGGVMIDL